MREGSFLTALPFLYCLNKFAEIGIISHKNGLFRTLFYPYLSPITYNINKLYLILCLFTNPYLPLLSLARKESRESQDIY